MPNYKATIQDFSFILNEVLEIGNYKHLKGFDSIDEGFISAMLGEAAKLCEEVLFPLNQSGDKNGCTFTKGEVHMPKGFKEAYQAYSQGGWGATTADPEYGGQGLPEARLQ